MTEGEVFNFGIYIYTIYDCCILLATEFSFMCDNSYSDMETNCPLFSVVSHFRGRINTFNSAVILKQTVRAITAFFPVAIAI